MATTRRKAKESDLQTRAIEAFKNAFPELKILRINSGLAKSLHGGHTIHLAPKGTPDLYIPKPQLHAEMKRPGEELKVEQLAWQQWARENEVPHIVCDTPEDLVAHVRSMIEPSAPAPMTADHLRGLTVISVKWHPSMTEQGYQDQFCEWMRDAGIKYEREHIFCATDRVDFLVEDGIAVEFKLKCSSNETLRQLARYAQHKSVREILLISATRTALQNLPPTLNGKPVRGLHIGRSF